MSDLPDPGSENREKETESNVVPYYVPEKKKRRSSNAWQIAGGFGIYQLAILLLTMTYPAYVPVSRSLTEWLALTVLLLLGAFGVALYWNKWGYLKGMVAAFLLAGSCCGLLYHACGNPFQPLL